MTRKGKIARLPFKIREELNSRLRDGEEFESLLIWVNSLPETEAALKKFDEKPINQPNLSEWKAGGYLEWIAKHDAFQLAAAVGWTETSEDSEDSEEMGRALLRWLTVQCAATARELILKETDPEARWRRILECCSYVAALHRGELAEERLAQGESWIKIEEERNRGQLKEKQASGSVFMELLKMYKPGAGSGPTGPKDSGG